MAAIDIKALFAKPSPQPKPAAPTIAEVSPLKSRSALLPVVRESDILRRVPPHNVEAEMSVLGAVLLANESIEQAMRVLSAGDFYREAHRLIYTCMVDIWRRNGAVDPVILHNELKTRGHAEMVGGAAYLTELAGYVPTAANIEHYAKIVKDMAGKRNLASIFTQLATEAYNGVSLDGLIGEAERQLDPVLKGQSDGVPALVRTQVEVFDWGMLQKRRASHVREWAVEGWLARKETSSWSGKVEAGKTTLMRELTMAVIRGEPFLGHETVKGRVFYAMLDADGEDVTYDEFEKLGFDESDAQSCLFMFEPMLAQIRNGFEQFVRLLQDFRPTLVIIDPYPRLKIIQDFHSYSNTYLMSELSALAKLVDAHVALPGHIPRGRNDDDDVATAGFGSISFSGGVNARFVVTDRSGMHTVRTSKGKAAGFQPLDAEYRLLKDDYTSRITLGSPWSWKDKGRAVKEKVLAFLKEHNDQPFDLATLARTIEIQRSVVRSALILLYGSQEIKRSGEGLKNDPYIYAAFGYDGEMTIKQVRTD